MQNDFILYLFILSNSISKERRFQVVMALDNVNEEQNDDVYSVVWGLRVSGSIKECASSLVEQLCAVPHIQGEL